MNKRMEELLEKIILHCDSHDQLKEQCSACRTCDVSFCEVLRWACEMKNIDRATNTKTPTDIAQLIAKGEKRRRNTDYDEIEARILKKLKKLPTYDLDWVECTINHLIARTQQPPEPPRMDERDKSAELGPCTTWGPGSNPMPLNITKYIDALTFDQLLVVADRYGVHHNECRWLDDEWPDKEDKLRVAVAEAMEKAKSE